MKIHITFVTFLGLAALQAQAIPVTARTTPGGVPMNVAKQLNGSPASAPTAENVSVSGLPMSLATRDERPGVVAAVSIRDQRPIVLSGLSEQEAKRL
jgi:hypothetical protein